MLGALKFREQSSTPDELSKGPGDFNERVLQSSLKAGFEFHLVKCIFQFLWGDIWGAYSSALALNSSLCGSSICNCRWVSPATARYRFREDPGWAQSVALTGILHAATAPLGLLFRLRLLALSTFIRCWKGRFWSPAACEWTPATPRNSCVCVTLRETHSLSVL